MRNGAGTYVLPAGQPVVTGTTISSATHNTLATDLANALTTSIATDGQSVVTANIPFAGYKLTGIGAATVAGDALRFENLASITSGQQAQTGIFYTTAGTTTAYTLTPTPAITSLVAGQRFNVVFNAANTTASTTLAISGLAAKTLKVYNAAGAKIDPAIGWLAANMIADVVYDGTDYVVLGVVSGKAASGPNSDITSLLGLTIALSVAQGGTGSATGPILRSYLAGLGMSTAGSSATMSIAAGVATDSTNVALLSVSAIAKTTANWVVGTAAGGKSLAAAIANNTWYHFYAIRRPDTDVKDVCFSTNASGLVAADFVAGGGNVPDAYTQFRRIGSGRTNGSAQWTLFFQDGDEFIWDTAVNDVAVTDPGTAAVTRTLTVPLGVVVETILSVYDAAVTTAHYTLLTSLAQADTVPSFSNFSIANGNSLMRTINSRGVRTNTSAQIRTRQSASGVADEFYIITLGWKDRRGRDA